MKINNQQIYELYTSLANSFIKEQRYFPAKVNFIIQKNLKTLYEAAQEIENIRLNIVKNYGIVQNNNDFIIEPQNIQQANRELNELSEIEQEINILFLTFKDIEEIEFTPAQMGAILFMIKEDEGEE